MSKGASTPKLENSVHHRMCTLHILVQAHYNTASSVTASSSNKTMAACLCPAHTDTPMRLLSALDMLPESFQITV